MSRSGVAALSRRLTLLSVALAITPRSAAFSNTLDNILNESQHALCTEAAALYIECGKGTFETAMGLGYATTYGGAQLSIQAGTTVESLIEYFEDVKAFVGIEASVVLQNPSRVELRSIWQGQDHFVNAIQLDSVPRLFARPIGGEPLIAFGEFGCSIIPDTCAERGSVCLSAGVGVFECPGGVTIEIMANFGSHAFTFASGSSVENIISSLNWVGPQAGYHASRDSTNSARINIRSSVLGSDAFVSVVQIEGDKPLLFANPAGGEGMYEYVDAGRDAVPGDVDCDRMVGVPDLLRVVQSWGACPPTPTTCPADLDANEVVNVSDLLTVIANWGQNG